MNGSKLARQDFDMRTFPKECPYNEGIVGYFDLIRLEHGPYTKPGVRGYPYLEPTQALMLEVLQNLDLEGVESALDLTAQGHRKFASCCHCARTGHSRTAPIRR
jgi:hypothetical protein